MALVAADYIKPIKLLGGGATPIMSLKKAAATVCYKGMVCIATAGLVVAAADGPTTGTILGISLDNITAAEAKTAVSVCPALPDVVFSAHTATGDTGGTTTITDANLFVAYGLSLEGTAGVNVWYINVADATDECALAIKRLYADDTAWAEVEFTFSNSLWIKSAVQS